MEGPIYHLEKVVRAQTDDREDFTGPLDLILALLSKNKMEIKDIQISVILDQYLSWMEQRKRLDLEVASDFVTMAAQLIFIKSRMLLSIHDEEALSEMELLIASLEAHQRHENYMKVKKVVPKLDGMFDLGSDYITKGPEALPLERLYRYTHHKRDLSRAMAAIRERMGAQLPPPMSAFEGIVGREPYPVSDKAAELIARLARFGVTRFQALFHGNRSRSEVVATFIAVLELCKAKRIRLTGTTHECTVACTGEGEDMELSTDV